VRNEKVEIASTQILGLGPQKAIKLCAQLMIIDFNDFNDNMKKKLVI